MKIKNDVDLWSVLEESSKPQKRRFCYYNEEEYPTNVILELEDIDFLDAIELCHKHKKYNLKKEYEALYSSWKYNKQQVFPNDFLKTFVHQISYTRKHHQQAREIRKQVFEVFKKHKELLENMDKASIFYLEFNTLQDAYFELEKKWVNNCAAMDKLNSLKAQGITAQEFRWNLVEEPETDDE